MFEISALLDLRSELVPVFFATVITLMVLEYAASRLAHLETHDAKETAASFVIAIGNRIVRTLEAGLVAAPFFLAYQYRLFDVDLDSPLAWVALFLLVEFVYYWHHRASHTVRWLWATHSVHHSPTRLNLTAGIRLGWTAGISGHFLFYVPLALIGFHPLAIAAVLGANLGYQFFIHSELAPRLGPLEWILNTPTHHRVHHACNDECLDKNFGGTLIVFDRLFGTFATPPKREPLRYGLVGRSPSHNPVTIVFGEWAAILKDLRKSDAGPASWLPILLGPPRAHGDTRNEKQKELKQSGAKTIEA
ncbi:MAG: sterol desaturase family protein [Hyphomicrobiaceae bacterium]|nr:sterol desaturase family protein [Hyphomicrobiaceae bacterium]